MNLKRISRQIGMGGLAAVLGTGISLAAVSDAQANERVRWQVPTGFPTTLPGLDAIVPVSEWLEGMSNGRIQLRYYQPGELIPPFEILDAVSEGRYDAGFTWIGYDVGTLPATPVFGTMPFGPDPWVYAAWNYFGEGHQLLNEMYAPRNVHAMLCGVIGPEAAGWFNKPITSIEDYDGLRIRFAGIGGRVLEELGAAVTMIPGGEVYQALDRGVIDAAEFSQPAIDSMLGFQQVVKNYLLPGWHQSFTATHLLVNKKSWEKLETSTQQMIETACKAATMHTLAHTEAIQGDAIREIEAAGVKAQEIPREVLEELKVITDRVLAELAEEDEMFKRAWHSQRDFAERHKIWREMGYMPADLK